MPEPLSAEREAEVRDWAQHSRMLAETLSAHDYHRAAATRAQAELERVTREVELAFVCPDCKGTKGSMCVTPDVSEWADCSTCNGEGTMPITAITDMHKQIRNLDGMYWEQRGHREDAERQLAALQSRNAALEAELAQARERERGLREDYDQADRQRAYATAQWESWVKSELEGTSNFPSSIGEISEFRASWEMRSPAKAALAGGKEGA